MNEDVPLKKDELLGAVKLKDRWRFFGGTIAEWILDYRKYDPDYDPSKWDYVFRGGLLVVDKTDAETFCMVMQPHEVSIDELRNLSSAQLATSARLTIVVDFDKRVLINGYYDLSIEEYVPNGWEGRFGDPLDYLPPDLRAIWMK